VTETNFTVFVVEDDPAILTLLDETLNELVAVELFPSAEACLSRLATQKPELFLLDVGLPGMDGTSLCQQLKDDLDTDAIPVTMMSGIDSIDARLSAYDAGAQDFIVKPFKSAELVRKVKIIKNMLEQKRQLSEQAGFAQRTAFSVMNSMSELGVVMQFLSRSFRCATGDEVAQAIFESLTQYDLPGALQYRLRDDVHCVSPQGVDLPLEVSIFERLQTCGRIYQLKNRCVFNFARISILITSMPLDDADKCGRIRDNIAMLGEGADARLAAIEVEQANRRQRDNALRALKQVESAISVLRESNRDDRLRSAELMQNLLVELEGSFVSLGLTEGQEIHLQELVKGYAELLINIQQRDSKTESQLETVAAALAKITQ